MTPTENDLRDALRELELRADEHGAPPAAGILADTLGRPDRPHNAGARRLPGWLPPLAAAVLVAAGAVTAVALGSQHGGHHDASPQQGPGQVAGRPHANRTAHRVPTASHPTKPAHRAPKHAAAPSAASVLDDAATALDAESWTPPDPSDYFYVRTDQATTWTSVSGLRAGDGRTADGTTIWVSGCAHGHIVSTGESGSCTLDDVPHYLGDAPTAPAAWDSYLERLAPGARAANAQGKIIVEVLHQDLVAPAAAAALLRYTTTCPGLHTVDVAPVAGERLVGVTCASMTNGSYALVFDAATHELVGFVTVTSGGEQDGAAEIIEKTGIVTALGRTP